MTKIVPVTAGIPQTLTHPRGITAVTAVLLQSHPSVNLY